MQEKVTIQQFLECKGYLGLHEEYIERAPKELQENIDKKYQVTVLCLKYGEKYGTDYVNKLYNMVSRNIKINYEFVCITENPIGLNKKIRIIPLEINPEIEGWWYKPFVFSRELDIRTDTVLFLDLDVIIFNSIDKFFEYKPDENFIAIKGFTIKNTKGINSSCFRFNRSNYFHLYDDYIKNYTNIIKEYVGDQDWINDNVNSYYWPKLWVQSFKHDMMEWPENRIVKDPQNIRKIFSSREPIVKERSAIAVFHGRPNPHELNNKWCIKHWK